MTLLMDSLEARKFYDKPHLVASAKMANEILMFMNADIADLRQEVNELELAADLYLNKLLMEGKGVELQKSNWRISEVYQHWRKEKGRLSDIRAWRKLFQRHADLLYDQEKYNPQRY